MCEDKMCSICGCCPECGISETCECACHVERKLMYVQEKHILDDLYKIILHQPYVTRSGISRQINMKARELDEYIDTLKQQGRINGGW